MKKDAKCPICNNSWQFDLRYAILEPRQTEELRQYEFIYIVCENCDHNDATIEHKQIELEKAGRGLYFTR